MSKRKLNQQQQQRINQAQLLCHHNHDGSIGLVLCRYGKQAQITTESNTIIECHIRPNVPTLVAGDRVVWQPIENSQHGVIVSIVPRSNVLERLDKQGITKPLAANISQLIIVVAAEPCISWQLLDSYLISAQKLSLQTCIVCNKTDLPSAELISDLQKYYQPINYSVIFLSRNDPQSYNLLSEHLQAQTSIFVGQSGVGKSSIIKQLLANHDLKIETSELSQNKHGQHTTSFARYYNLESGGAIIDSPGVRSFQPPHWSQQTILNGYPELENWRGRCQFRNCTHQNTPGCAITDALQKNAISELRYTTLMKALHDPVIKIK